MFELTDSTLRFRIGLGSSPREQRRKQANPFMPFCYRVVPRFEDIKTEHIVCSEDNAIILYVGTDGSVIRPDLQQSAGHDDFANKCACFSVAGFVARYVVI